MRIVALIGLLTMIATGCGRGEDEESAPPETEDAEPGTGDTPDETDDGDGTGEQSFEELLDAATEEGSVTWYTASPTALVEELAAAFEDEYDISVDLFREGGEQILARMEAELRSGPPGADVVTYSNYAAFLSHKERGVIAEYTRHDADQVNEDVEVDFDFVDDYFSAGGVHMVCYVYNTDVIDEADAPTSWEDLTDPKWSGQVATGSPEYAGAAVQMAAALEDALGDDFLERWGANDVLVAQGFGNSQDLAVSGERPIGTVVGIRAWPAMADGQPIQVVYPEEGCVNVPLGEGVMEEAANPNAGRLLANFMLTEPAQAIFAKHGFYPLREGVEPLDVMEPLGTFPLISADNSELIDPDVTAELKQRWAETMGTAQ